MNEPSERCMIRTNETYSRTILMGNQILPWCINIPAMGPSSHGQCNLFTHEAPADKEEETKKS